MIPKFTHLHVHTQYSLLDGLPKIEEVLTYVKENDMDSVAITDHGVLYGAVEFYKKAKQAGIKPIIGCEIYTAFEGMAQKRPNIDNKRYHLVLLVKNETGYRNLVQLTTKAHLEGFYYKPRVDEDLLFQHADGLIALSACLQGKIPRLITAGRIEEAEKTARRYQEAFGKENFYLEIQHHPGLPEQIKANKGLIELSKKHGIPLVATNDCHYLRPEDAEAQDILMLINTGAKPDDPDRLTMKQDDFSMKPPKKMAEQFKDTPEAISNTQKIVKACNFEFKLGEIKLPSFSVPDGSAPDEYLRGLCEKGLEQRKKEFKNEKETKERLEYELEVIKKTGFASYFLIVADFVKWAKENKIVVGPGRGSVGGSLVAYLTNITNINPLQHDLLFERFLTQERISPPDIDLDFADTRRDEVIEYVSQKYGQDRVAQIITFGTMAARAAIRDVGRVLKYPYSLCDKIAKMIPFGFNLDQTLKRIPEFRKAYESDEQIRRLVDLSKKLEGVARHASTHACGVVISAEPLDSLVPVQRPTQNDSNIITQYEMYSIEDLGLLKMDFLGLKNLTMIEQTIKLIEIVRGKTVVIDKIPQDDKKTYKLLQKAETTSVFQLECLSGDTQISHATIKKMYEQRNRKNLHSLYLDEGKVHKNKIIDIVYKGKQNVYNLITEDNWYVKATKGHYFLTENGWKKLQDIKIGNKVLIKSRGAHFVYNTCKTCGKQINGQKEGKSNFCYSCSASFYKNPSKPEARKKISLAQIEYYQKGNKPWNHGLTTENSEKWKKTAEKISKALSGRTFEEIYGPQKAKEIKEKLSMQTRGSNNPMFGRPVPHRRGGFRQDLNHYVRSSWEADFARILKLHNLKYKYEPQTFSLIKQNREILHYTPDFYVKSNNTYYEIKGWLHDLDKEKMALFQAQYPQYNFVLISATKFAEFALRYKNLIQWECPRLPVKDQFKFREIKNILDAGEEDTYDIIMAEPGNNFVANGFVVHNSSGMKKWLRQLEPSNFEDISTMLALYRPGPMQFIPEYIARKQKRKKVEYLHPKLKPILESTYGLPIFQEQMMQIAREIAGFSLSEADILRKAIGKKIASLLSQQKEKFISGAVRQDTDKKIAEKIWSWFLPFAQYGFNKSHSVGYGIIAYQTAYLKANYPVEFMAAVLASEKQDVERIAFLLEECKRMEIEVLPPDINESFKNFTVVDKNKIRFGLLAIKNVGHNIVQTIVGERSDNGKYQSIGDFVNRIHSRDLNKKSMESLIKAGAFDKLEERNMLLGNLERLLSCSREIQNNKKNGQTGLFDGAHVKTTINLEQMEPASTTEKLRWEKELLGLFVSGHPLEDYQKSIAKKATPISKILQELTKTDDQPGFPLNVSDKLFRKIMPGTRLKICGLITRIKKIITKSGRPMFFVKIQDLTGEIEAIIFPNSAEQFAPSLQENKIVVISGRVDFKEDSPKMIVESIEEIIEE
ncbi:MAG: hypothetical protein COT37_00410 [Parcubacteria group bacterium CG08_land_8_20_14_0_20_43_9]|nr:MAG: hypothetical protein COT37_00410 [Parcubacteria group bacterium CG08_land_8_20_14_0_20_43_9]